VTARRVPVRIPKPRGKFNINPAVSFSSSPTNCGPRAILALVAQPEVRAKRAMFTRQKTSLSMRGASFGEISAMNVK